MQFSPLFICLATCLMSSLTAAKPMADIGDYPMQTTYDSYSVIPKQDDEVGDSELSLDMVPPAVLESSAPHIYYMYSDGVAVPAEGSQRRVVRKRETLPADASADEGLLTAETVIIGLPSGQSPFGTPAVNLGFRPARAYYARRYHKYPWNYH